MIGLANMMMRKAAYVLWTAPPVRGHIGKDGRPCESCRLYFEQVDACPLRMFGSEKPQVMRHEWVGPDKVIRWVHCKVCLTIGRVSTMKKPGNLDDECKGPGNLRPMESVVTQPEKP